MRISPSQIKDFEKCQRCFWLGRTEKIPWPRGIFPSLPGGMDRRLKEHYDAHRPELPPELTDKLLGLKLFADVAKLNQWRSWRSGLVCDIGDGDTLSGALDDLAVDDKFFYVLDFKTRGAPPKPGATRAYYGTQGDSYAAMLRANKMPPAEKGLFVYYWPKNAEKSKKATVGCLFNFHVEVVEEPLNPDRAIKLAKEAIACLAGPLPKTDPACDQCAYVKKRSLRMTEIFAEAKAEKEKTAA